MRCFPATQLIFIVVVQVLQVVALQHVVSKSDNSTVIVAASALSLNCLPDGHSFRLCCQLEQVFSSQHFEAKSVSLALICFISDLSCGIVRLGHSRVFSQFAQIDSS